MNTETGKWITDDCAAEFKFACKHHNGEWEGGTWESGKVEFQGEVNTC